MKSLSVIALAALSAVALAYAPPASAQAAAVIAPADAPAAAKAAGALIGRVLGARATEFAVEIIPADNGKNVFEIESVNGKIVLRGDNGVSVASALNHYLKHTANCQLSWCGDQLNLPKPLPAVPAKIRIINLHQYRVMFNYCTLSYTCSWWNWDRWERELDFLAMNGINAPLGVIGIEGVWYNTLTKLGFTDLEAREFLVGPTYFAWQWMTNIEGHGGPLPKHWIDERVKVGQKWMARARELGMTPIQQGFSGNVPRLLKKKQPQAAIAFQPTWCGFPGSAQLDPTDPYFKVIGKTFLEENIKLYGNGHLWAADPFHESEPPKPGAAYLDTVGKTIFALMTEVDTQATWAMQAWSIRRGIACAAPKGRLLVLDLAGGRNDFWGHDFVKGQLHNFGGRINNHGDVRYITGNPFAGAAKNPACKGVGLFPEAIVQNPVFYDAVYDMFWSNSSVDTMQWVTDYARRRYGVDSPKVAEAWKILVTQGPYVHESVHAQENSSMIAARPALTAKKSGPNQGFGIPYPPLKLVEAVELLFAEADKASGSDGYRYDCADFTRQILTNYAQHLHKEIRLAYLQKDKATFEAKAAEFHQLLLDVDTLLASRTEFLFGKWLADARSYGITPEEQEYYAWNAAMLVTIWGPEKTPEIFDYSWREWSGLIKEYYLPRWQKFHAILAESIDKGDYRDPAGQCYGRESLRANAFYSKLADWEIGFTRNAPKNLPSKPVGDSVALAKQLLAKYKPMLEKAYSAEAQAALNEGLAMGGAAIPAGSVKLGTWKPNEITTAGKEITLDAAKVIKDEGTYEVTFTYTAGGQRLEIDWVAVTVNGNEIMRDTHIGWAGDPRKDTTYKLDVGGIVFNGKYEIKAKVRTDGGNDSNGFITMKKVK